MSEWIVMRQILIYNKRKRLYIRYEWCTLERGEASYVRTFLFRGGGWDERNKIKENWAVGSCGHLLGRFLAIYNLVKTFKN